MAARPATGHSADDLPIAVDPLPGVRKASGVLLTIFVRRGGVIECDHEVRTVFAHGQWREFVVVNLPHADLADVDRLRFPTRPSAEVVCPDGAEAGLIAALHIAPICLFLLPRCFFRRGLLR